MSPERAEYLKQYYQKNKEKIDAYQKRYRIESAETYKKTHSNYYQKHKERIKAFMKVYRAANKEKISAARKVQYLKKKFSAEFLEA